MQLSSLLAIGHAAMVSPSLCLSSALEQSQGLELKGEQTYISTRVRHQLHAAPRALKSDNRSSRCLPLLVLLRAVLKQDDYLISDCRWASTCQSPLHIYGVIHPHSTIHSLKHGVSLNKLDSGEQQMLR